MTALNENYGRVTAGPATRDTERVSDDRRELEALIRRIVREEIAAARPTMVGNVGQVTSLDASNVAGIAALVVRRANRSMRERGL